MPPRESLRPVRNANVDEYVRIRASQGARSVKVNGRQPIVDSEIGWDDVPARRSRRRHPVAAADDWGLVESDAWVVEPPPAPERLLSTRDQARRERSAQAARAELTGQSGPDLGPLENESEISAARIDHAGADVSVSAAATDDIWGVRPTVSGERRTIVITGRGAEGQLPRRRGWEASLPLHERSGFKPDRVAMWAVLLGVILLLVAATSSHAAMLATHLAH